MRAYSHILLFVLLLAMTSVSMGFNWTHFDRNQIQSAISKGLSETKIVHKFVTQGLSEYNQKHRERSEDEDNLRIVTDVLHLNTYLEVGEASAHKTHEIIKRCQDEKTQENMSQECKLMYKIRDLPYPTKFFI